MSPQSSDTPCLITSLTATHLHDSVPLSLSPYVVPFPLCSPWVPAAQADPPAAPQAHARPHAGKPADPGAGIHCRRVTEGLRAPTTTTTPPPATPLTQQGYCRHHMAKVGAVLWGRYRLGSQPSPLTLSSLGRVGSPQVFPNLWVSRRSGTLPSPLSPLTCEPRRVPCTP